MSDSAAEQREQIKMLMRSQDSDDKSRAQLDVPMIMISGQDRNSIDRISHNSDRSLSKRSRKSSKMRAASQLDFEKKKVVKKMSSFSN